MSENPETNHIYGRLDVTVPKAVYEAGRVSTVTILLSNPFDESVEVLEIQGPRSSHLSAVVRDTLVLSRDKKNISRPVKKKPNWLSYFFESLSKVLITEVSFGGFRLELPASRSVLNIQAKPNSETDIDTDLTNYEQVNISVDEGAKIRFLPQAHELDSEERKIIIIEPHCEAVAYFEISTIGWLFFTPTRRSLNTLIRYRVNNREKTQVVTSEFDVRPPLLSVIIGAVTGSILGTLAKILNQTQTFEWQPIIVSLGAAIVMSLIATIALSRKTGTQGFITVEDFFGGFVVGALIGYGGSAYFEQTIVPSPPSSPSTLE